MMTDFAESYVYIPSCNDAVEARSCIDTSSEFTDEQLTTINQAINQGHNVLTRGSLSTAYTCKQLTKDPRVETSFTINQSINQPKWI